MKAITVLHRAVFCTIGLILSAVPLTSWGVDLAKDEGMGGGQTGTMIGEEETIAEVDIYRGPDFKISGAIGLGIANTRAREIVYYTGGEGYPDWEDGHKMSELIWETKNALMLGGEISVQALKRIYFNLAGWARISGGGAHMDDYDWLYEEYPDLWSDWSHSPTTVDKGLILNGNIAYAFLKGERLHLRLVGGFKFDNWKWRDKNGYYTYSSGGFRNDSGWFDSTTGIIYEQKFFIPYGGLAGDLYLFPTLSAGLHVYFSPYVWAQSDDDHVTRAMHIKDTFHGGRCLMIGAELKWKFFDPFYAMASFDWQEIPVIKGDSEYSGSFTGDYDDIAGIYNRTYIFAGYLGCEF